MAALGLAFLLVLGTVDVQAIEPSDARFRAVQPAEAGFAPPSLPAGFTADQLQFWNHRIGADDSPALQIATASDERVWVDANRDGSWTELSPIPSAASTSAASTSAASTSAASTSAAVTQWSGVIRASAAARRARLWPTPDAIDIRIDRDRVTGLWRLASLAQIDSELMIDGAALKIRLRDENSDGKFEGLDDSLLIDLNGNGQFEKLREQIPLTKFFRAGGRRYALVLDREQQTLGAQSIDATGTAELTFEGWEELVQAPTEMHVVLQSSTGVQVVFNNTQPQVIPVGRYHVYAATFNWDGDEKWRMTFSRWDSQPQKTFDVVRDAATKITVLGQAQLTAEIEGLTYSNHKWQATLQPALKTESGLYLTRASSGRLQPTVDGMLVANILSSDARVLTSGSTQFACGTFCPIPMAWKNESAAQVILTFNSGPLAGVMVNRIPVQQKAAE